MNSSVKHSIFHYVIPLFLLAFLFFGLFHLNDYGVSWDEPINRITGYVNYAYLTQENNLLETYIDKNYGPVFEVFLVAVEKIFRLTEVRSIYLMRHALTFFVYCVGLLFFYRLNRKVLKSDLWAFVALIFLILSPRIFAHAFYNSKDIPFMSFYILSMFTAIKFISEKNVKVLLWHALITSMLIGIRIMGLLIPVLTIGFLVKGHLLSEHQKVSNKRFTCLIAGYGTLVSGLTILFMPILWKNPIEQLIAILKGMGKFPWGGQYLFMGDIVQGASTPAYYFPVWFGITTPILYSALFIVGLFVLMYRILTQPKMFIEKNDGLIFCLLCLVIPIFTVIVLKSVLYDAWRHLFFVYPSIVIVSVYGLREVFTYFKERRIFKALTIFFVMLCLGQVLGRMVVIHPYENLYFNRLAGKNMLEVKRNYEMDYWGLSYRKALEFILANDSSNKIQVYVVNLAGKGAQNLFIEPERKRLEYVNSPQDADYFISNYRHHKEEYPLTNEFYAITIDGAKVMVVYKLNSN